jgi:hypothetical protein
MLGLSCFVAGWVEGERAVDGRERAVKEENPKLNKKLKQLN